ncbi:MAG TPA: hypothetical protein VG411_14720 [Actinomycetota bacterium]|nr:hypothetical protein [Actinomycetota bacterium]
MTGGSNATRVRTFSGSAAASWRPTRPETLSVSTWAGPAPTAARTRLASSAWTSTSWSVAGPSSWLRDMPRGS